jgi:hypothetical protein
LGLSRTGVHGRGVDAAIRSSLGDKQPWVGFGGLKYSSEMIWARMFMPVMTAFFAPSVPAAAASKSEAKMLARDDTKTVLLSGGDFEAVVRLERDQLLYSK